MSVFARAPRASRPTQLTAEHRNYVYFKDADGSDRYAFTLASKAKYGKPFVVPGHIVQAMVLAYSRAGGDATINELARTHGMHRTTVREILKALGKTHDSAPFTDEQIQHTDEETLVEDVVRLKEEAVLRKAERQAWNKTKALAEKATNFNKFVADTLRDVLQTQGIPPIPVLPIQVVRSKPIVDVVLTPSDLHYGKQGWALETGEGYDRATCAARLREVTEKAIARFSAFGQVDTITVGAGGDWFHIDSMRGGPSTTKGTPQNADGNWTQIFLEGCELAAAYIQRLQAEAPVRIVQMAGNHDYQSSIMLIAWLKERFRDNSRVIVEVSPAPRQYVKLGDSLVGFTHGDGMRDSKLPSVMAVDQREAWGAAKHRVFFTGHMHTLVHHEYAGTKVIRMPSLAGTDAWHAAKGYVGNRKALAAYVFDKKDGLIADLSIYATRHE